MISVIATGVGFLVVGIVALIIGWKVHPWTVGAMTQWIESPAQQFVARLGTSVVWAVGAIWLMSNAFPNFMVDALKVADAASPMTNNHNSNYYEEKAANDSESTVSMSEPDPFPSGSDDAVTPTPPAATTQAPVPSPRVEEKPVTPIVAAPKPEPKPEPVKEREIAKAPQTDSVATKIAELKGELAVVDMKIETERARWQGGIDTINRLTNFKRTPVREGSPQYHQAMAASRIVQEVEAGAPALKAEKARLTAMIESLEN